MVKMEGVSGGRVAQLGEHLLCKQGAAGSSPATSTNYIFFQLNSVDVFSAYHLLFRQVVADSNRLTSINLILAVITYYTAISSALFLVQLRDIRDNRHYKHWTRQQMVDFFHNYTSEDEPEVQAETDRYIAVPGQALGYKLGQLEILKLRLQAQEQLGTKYDVRAFHDEVLAGGALPLDVLEQRVNAWVAAQNLPRAHKARHHGCRNRGRVRDRALLESRLELRPQGVVPFSLPYPHTLRFVDFPIVAT